MCGIFCSLSRTHPLIPDATIADRLQGRGPDSTASTSAVYSSASTQPASYITLYSTVLSLRGEQTVTQPYQSKDQQFTLCWNGEAWKIDGIAPSGNDTEAVHRMLVDALKGSSNSEESATAVASTLSRIAGPYSFVFADHLRGDLFFGRDFLGRRSLLMRTTEDGDLIVCSVSSGDAADGWSEVEADGIYHVNFNASDRRSSFENGTPSHFTAERVSYIYADSSLGSATGITSVIPHLSLNREVPSSYRLLDQKSSAVTNIESLLLESLSLRVLNIPNPPVDEHQKLYSSDRAKIAILFSGGLDCTLLARISHNLLDLAEPVDLLNVAFENPRIHKQTNQDAATRTAYELCPDRITGRASHMELQRICPGRQWRFVAIDVPYSATTRHRDKIVSLMHPHNTEMDLSISNALYFAARGEGYLTDSQESYTTSARVLLSGLGADELFAGYTRHATAFKRNGFAGLLDELELDVSRLGKRNLGRDDRVMSHWSREVRFPYLDERLVDWALNVPLTEKCGFGEPAGDDEIDGAGIEPGKKVLRCLAWRLGMKNVAREKKRAIQFGARTAKMETGKTKGTHILS